MGVPRTPEWETLRHIRESTIVEEGSEVDTASDSEKVKLAAIERIKAAKNKCSVVTDAEHSEEVVDKVGDAYTYEGGIVCRVSDADRLIGTWTDPSGGATAPSEQPPEKPPLSLGELIGEAIEWANPQSSRPSAPTPPVKPGFDPSPTRETSYTRTHQQAAPLATHTPGCESPSEPIPPQSETPSSACKPPLLVNEFNLGDDSGREFQVGLPEGAVREIREGWDDTKATGFPVSTPPESPKGAGWPATRLVELPNGTLVNPAHVICVEGGGLQHRQGTLDAVVVRLSGGAAGGFGGGTCDQRFEVPWTHPADGRTLTAEDRAAIAEGIRQQILAALTQA